MGPKTKSWKCVKTCTINGTVKATSDISDPIRHLKMQNVTDAVTIFTISARVAGNNRFRANICAPDKITDSVIDRRKQVRFNDARFSAFNGALFRHSTVLSHGAQTNAANRLSQSFILNVTNLPDT